MFTATSTREAAGSVRPVVRLAWRIVLTMTAAAASVSTAAAQDQVIGLLTLPGIFGSEPCERSSGDTVRLVDSPNTNRTVATIRVDVPWTLHPAGGCEGRVVGVHRVGEADAQPLPTREFAADQPAAIVTDRRQRWFRLRLADGSAWVQQPGRAEFLPLDRLVMRGLTYLTEEWDGRIAATAGGPLRGTSRADLSERAVRVTGTRRTAAGFWLEVDLLDASICETGREPTVIGHGWVPAHATSGEPNVWFHPRGC